MKNINAIFKYTSYLVFIAQLCKAQYVFLNINIIFAMHLFEKCIMSSCQKYCLLYYGKQ